MSLRFFIIVPHLWAAAVPGMRGTEKLPHRIHEFVTKHG